MKAKPLGLGDLAKRRLQRLQEPSPEDLEKEIEEARREGYRLLAIGPLRILLRDYTVAGS